MAIYEKSLIGHREIQGSKRQLNLRQRQVLIMVDGKRTAEALQEALQNPQTGTILMELEREGFIIRIDAALPSRTETAPQRIAADRSAEFPLNDMQQQAIRALLLESTDQYLGIMGQALRQHIIAARNGERLRACISEWHMAMRESKAGRATAPALMEEVQALMRPEETSAEV